MREENKSKIEKNNKNKRKKNKIKRQISIFTIMLWVFLISTMITITVNSTKESNALEVEDENWNIQLVMYDRSSDTPNDAITDFTWNAVNISESKQLCMQINYACTINKGYQPGEIKITIPGISKGSFSELYRSSEWIYNNWLRNNITIAADKYTDTIKNYNWSYRYDSVNNIYEFTNNMEIAKNEHFEGTIQLLYNLDPKFRIQTDLEFKAKMRENIKDADELISMESNTCDFHYTSKKKLYSVINTIRNAPKEIYQKLDDTRDNYYWVQCNFYIQNVQEAPIRAFMEDNKLISEKEGNLTEQLEEGCVMYDDNFEKLELKENNTYYNLFFNYVQTQKSYYIGYPKSKYNEGDTITNTVELFGRYEDEEEVQKLAEKSDTVTLKDFDFEYKGELYSIDKSIHNKGYADKLYDSSIKNKGNITYWNMNVTAFYTENLMDVEIGDDLLYITRQNGEVTKLNDDEYNFTSIEIPVLYTYDKYVSENVGEALVGYNYEVQVRYRGSQEYVVLKSGVTDEKNNISYFKMDDYNIGGTSEYVAGVKLVIKDLDKTLYPKDPIRIGVKIKTNDCKGGNLYNFNYLKVYEKDGDGNRNLVNTTTKYNYTTPSTFKIAEYDMNTYGTYIQRAYSVREVKSGKFELNINKYNNNILNNVKKEKYETQYTLKSSLYSENYSIDNDCIIKEYDILPIGVKLVSTKEEIKESVKPYKYMHSNTYLKLKDGTRFKSYEELKNYIKENTEVEIEYNYKDSGRTKVSIIYNLSGISFGENLSEENNYINTTLKVEIPYDSILEYGTTYKNYAYSMWNNQEYGYNNFYSITDKGEYDEIARDIDEDGDITENLVYATSTININHVSSSQQSVIKQVKTDRTKGEFTSRSVDVTAGSEYTYKLRITTGSNSIRDLIIYDNIETVLDSDGNDISSGWKGEFLGVDTTYAKSKGYAPVVYYSEEINPGKLTEVPEKWVELTDEVDKTRVKSICVDLRYKENGSEMELSSNNLIFVLVNMRAPDTDEIISSASNMFSTNWRVKDLMGTVIDNVEGIYSNKINVNIYKKENEKKDIVGKKTWDDSENSYKIRPKNIIVKLLQDGIEYMRREVSESDDFEYEFLDVPIYKNVELEEYEYRIEEEEIPSYEVTYDGYNMTNKLRVEDIEVTKIWDDNNDENGLRPEVILIKLFDGEKLLNSRYIDEYQDWKCTFYGLPTYREDGSKIEYRVDEEVEKNVEFIWGGEFIQIDNFETDEEFLLYKNSYVKEIVGTTITNRYVDKDERIKIIGKKVWEDSDNKALKRPDSVILQLKIGDKVVNEVIVTEDTNWSYEFEVAKYDEEGNKIEYHIDEKETPKFYEKEIVDDFTVKNKFKVPDEKVKVEVIKLWEDLEDKYKKRPKSVTLQVLSKDKIVAEQVVNEKSNWRYEFELPKYDEFGNEVEYIVDEKEEVKNYEKRISGYTVINKCIYEPDEELIDTGDINVIFYIAIFFVAVIGIIVGINLVRKKK